MEGCVSEPLGIRKEGRLDRPLSPIIRIFEERGKEKVILRQNENGLIIVDGYV